MSVPLAIIDVLNAQKESDFRTKLKTKLRFSGGSQLPTRPMSRPGLRPRPRATSVVGKKQKTSEAAPPRDTSWSLRRRRRPTPIKQSFVADWLLRESVCASASVCACRCVHVCVCTCACAWVSEDVSVSAMVCVRRRERESEIEKAREFARERGESGDGRDKGKDIWADMKLGWRHQWALPTSPTSPQNTHTNTHACTHTRTQTLTHACSSHFFLSHSLSSLSI